MKLDFDNIIQEPKTRKVRRVVEYSDEEEDDDDNIPLTNWGKKKKDVDMVAHGEGGIDRFNFDNFSHSKTPSRPKFPMISRRKAFWCARN